MWGKLRWLGENLLFFVKRYFEMYWTKKVKNVKKVKPNFLSIYWHKNPEHRCALSICQGNISDRLERLYISRSSIELSLR